jgi:hypothetical protein
MIWMGSSDHPTTSTYPMQGESEGPLSNKKTLNRRAWQNQRFIVTDQRENKEGRTESDNKMFAVSYVFQHTIRQTLRAAVHISLVDEFPECFLDCAVSLSSTLKGSCGYANQRLIKQGIRTGRTSHT